MQSATHSISRAEWRFAGFVTAAVLFLIMSTYVYAFLVTPQDAVFLGVSASSPADSLIYFSYVEQARHTGHAFFWNVFSQESSAPSFFSPVWALLGYVGGTFHLSTPSIFVLAQLVSVFVYCVGAYWACTVFLSDVRTRQVAFAAMFLVAGIGFAFGVLPIHVPFGADLTYIPGYVLSTLLHSPLQALSQALLLVTFALFILTERRHAPRVVLYGSVALLALVHPYDLVPFFVACAGYAIIRTNSNKEERLHTWKTLRGTAIVCIPFAVYFVSLRWLDAGIGGWLRQNVTPSPSLIQMVLGFAPLIIVACVGVRRQWQHRDRALILLALWALAVPLLTYIPLPFQSRFANGYSVVLVVLGAPVFLSLVQQFRKPTFLFWVAVCTLLLMPTTIYNYVSTYRRYSESAAAGHSSVYPSKDFLAAATWLRNQPRSAFLSSYATSRVVAALSQQPAYQADSHQTVHYAQKAAAWEQLLTTPSTLQDFMAAHALRYYIETPFERDAYPALHTTAEETLERVFSSPGVTIFSGQAAQ